MTVNDIKEWIDFLLNKQQSGAYSGDQFNRALQVVNLEQLKVKIGLPEEYQIGVFQARQALYVTNRITEAVLPFLTPTTISKNNNGVFPIPGDFAAFSRMGYDYVINATCAEKPTIVEKWVEIVDDNEWPLRVDASIKKPTLKRPIANYTAGGFIVKPDEISTVNFKYVRKPAQPVWAYTVVDDEEIYSATAVTGFPNGSIQLEWPELMHPDFAVRIARYVGINLREDELIKMMEQRIAAGQ